MFGNNSNIDSSVLDKFIKKDKIHKTSIELTSSNENVLFGDILMIKNLKTNGYLATDSEELVYSLQDKNRLVVTTTLYNNPIARNSFQILP